MLGIAYTMIAEAVRFAKSDEEISCLSKVLLESLSLEKPFHRVDLNPLSLPPSYTAWRVCWLCQVTAAVDAIVDSAPLLLPRLAPQYARPLTDHNPTSQQLHTHPAITHSMPHADHNPTTGIMSLTT